MKYFWILGPLRGLMMVINYTDLSADRYSTHDDFHNIPEINNRQIGNWLLRPTHLFAYVRNYLFIYSTATCLRLVVHILAYSLLLKKKWFKLTECLMTFWLLISCILNMSNRNIFYYNNIINIINYLVRYVRITIFFILHTIRWL